MFVQIISGEAGYRAFQLIKQNFENLTQNFACQNASSFLASSASLRNRLPIFVQTIYWARQPAFRELDSGLCLSNFHVFPECVARVPVSLWGSGG